MSRPVRRWLEVRVRASGDDLDALRIDTLVTLGARGAVETDGWFVAHFEEPEDPGAFVGTVRASLEATPSTDDVDLEWGWQEHEEWAERWKRGLGLRRVSERLVVHPSWITPEGTREGDVVIVLDPGMAFGTAEHGTTRGALRLLDRAVRPRDHILDVGAGSGILTIAAAGLGAGSIVAIEGDPLACEALLENVDRNGASSVVTLLTEWATDASLAALGPVQGIVANIEAHLIEPLYDGFRSGLEPGGWLVVSGLLDTQWPGSRAKLESRGFQLDETDADGEWRSGLFRLPA